MCSFLSSRLILLLRCLPSTQISATFEIQLKAPHILGTFLRCLPALADCRSSIHLAFPTLLNLL